MKKKLRSKQLLRNTSFNRSWPCLLELTVKSNNIKEKNIALINETKNHCISNKQEASTQTASDLIENNNLNLITKSKTPVLSHQLTKDSGVDSDNALHIPNKKGLKFKNQAELSTEMEHDLQLDADFNKSSPIKSNFIGLSSYSHTTLPHRSSIFMSASTRDNSIEFLQNSSYSDDLNDHEKKNQNGFKETDPIFNYFTKNVTDENEDEILKESETDDKHASIRRLQFKSKIQIKFFSFNNFD